MHRLWGGDLIGMTAMPEAKLAREAEISYALIALVTDYDSWRQPPAAATQGTSGSTGKDLPAEPVALLKEIILNLDTASRHAMELMRKVVAMMSQKHEELLAAPAQNALQLAIWSDKSKIAPAEIERLRPLWGRYF